MKTSSVKRWTKYILIFFGTVVMLGLISVTVTLIVCDDEDYRKLAVWGVERVTGYRMIVEGRFSVNLSVSGTVADYENIEGLNLQLAADGQDLTKLLKMFQVESPSPGHLNFKARLSGGLAAPRVSNLKLSISGDPSVEISAEGAITNLRDGDGTDILLSVLCRNEDLLHKIFPDDWKVLEEFKFNGALRKVPTGFRIEDITARVVNNKGIDLETGGWLRLGNISEDLSVQEVDLNLHLTSPRTESIRPLLIDAIPEIGSVDARGRLTGPVEHLALEDMVIIRGGSGPVRVETRGRIGWISHEDGEALSDMDLARNRP
ncbi:hypothetical protein D1BOALGB6SA_3218 [Olavius sp. associated proteobacterium Delta 1]|nr:hypothetical protein D1BOALGB6SA_3218 [Olavius sp. associated proteobacterium Delta 1]